MRRVLAVLATAIAAVGLVSPAAPTPWKTGSRRTPPMGWNTWNTFECNINETLVKQTTDLMVSSGMRDRGYTYVNLDDCWMTRNRDAAGNLVADPAKFPSGLKALGDYIHARGMKFGIYESAGTETCQHYPGSLGHEQTDANSYASWGVDYLKYDNCGSPGGETQQDYVRRYSAMRDALKATGRPIAYSICEWGNFSPSTWAPDVGNLWRTTGDITNNWGSIDSIYRQNVGLASAAKPGAWNDPDMLEVGDGMDFQEDRAHFTLWAAMAAPLIAGADLRSASVATFSTYLNGDVIAVDQDPLGKQATRIATRERPGRPREAAPGRGRRRCAVQRKQHHEDRLDDGRRGRAARRVELPADQPVVEGADHDHRHDQRERPVAQHRDLPREGQRERQQHRHRPPAAGRVVVTLHRHQRQRHDARHQGRHLGLRRRREPVLDVHQRR